MTALRRKRMKRELTITAEAIDERALLAGRRMSGGMGAAVYFLGVVRGTEEEAAISAIEYEAFGRMAEHQFNLLFDEMEKRWPLESVRLVHRLGVVKVGEPSLWVEVIAPHRGEAFAACQWLIDEMKRVVPIWKKPCVEVRTQPDGSDEVLRLLKAQIPELASGVVEIKGIVRERGQRTIFAVHSTDGAIDPVGSCVGLRGIRIKTVSEQLSGEKIDIVRWSESTERFISNLIAPAKAERIVLDESARSATIHASPHYRALIIGRHGSRLQMLSRLLGWDFRIVDT